MAELRIPSNLGATTKLRSYVAADRKVVTNLLSFIDSLYPGGSGWLRRRLTDVEGGKAFCTIALYRNQLAGLLIETPKGLRNRKVSTFYVLEPFRHKGIGTNLLARHVDEWRKAGVDQVYITAPTKGQEPLQRFLIHHGFRLISVEAEKYGEGRDESVFQAPIERIWDSLH